MKGRASKTQMKSAMWQTIRMHYANCNWSVQANSASSALRCFSSALLSECCAHSPSLLLSCTTSFSYNADFDGDEMNLHVPQNELARAEAYQIANTDNQYVVPTDGSPLRGLIQDNVLTGVLLTKLDTFIDRQTYQQLLYSCLQISPTLKLRTPVPTILKPRVLWTGKQVIKGVLDLLTADRPPLNLSSKAKVPASSWGQHSEESVVIIRNNELLMGVLDKNQFGDAGYGLVHAVYELYGGPTSGELMSTLGRLFVLYLQTQGFTCGIDDMLLQPGAEANRAALKLEAEQMGLKAACQFAEITYDPSKPREINRILQEKMKQDKNNGARLDGAMKSALNPFTSNIISACLPKGQVKAFPANSQSSSHNERCISVEGCCFVPMLIRLVFVFVSPQTCR
jgi:DNA-directed RNA polymerase I subunit RPA1